MKCWNCLKEIPDTSKWCSYCEMAQDRKPTGSQDDVKKALKIIGPEMTAELEIMAASADTCEEFVAMALCGDCPACGSSETEDCENDPDINSILIARCKKCCTVFCSDCGRIYGDNEASASVNGCPSCGKVGDGDGEDDALAESGGDKAVRALVRMLGGDNPVTEAIPSCPTCGGNETQTCESAAGINSMVVIRCGTCQSLFCSECERAFENERPTEPGKTCPACGGENFDSFSLKQAPDLKEMLSTVVRMPPKLNVVLRCSDCGADFCVCCGKLL